MIANTAGEPGVGAWTWRVWLLAWPVILSNVTVPLVGAVDTAVAGHLEDAALIGGVALGTLVFNWIYWGFGFLRMGTTGLVAQAHGARDDDEVRAALGRALMLALLFGGTVALLRGPIAGLAFTVLDGSAAVEGHARAYIDIRALAAPAALCNIAVLGWLWGLQAMRAGFVQQVVVNLANIAFNLAFVFGLGWGLAGVAWASVAAQWLGLGIGAGLVLHRLGALDGVFARARLADLGRLRRMMAVNRDIFLRTIAVLAANAFFLNEAAKLGDVVLAAFAVLKVFQYMTAFGLDGFAHAAEALVGETVGQRSRARLRRAVIASTICAGLLAVVVALFYAVFGNALIVVMTDLETVRAVAAEYLVWAIVLPVVSVWSFQLDGVFIGATRTAAMRNTMILSAAGFVFLTGPMIDAWGPHGLWAAYALFMALRAATLAWCYPAIERDMAG